MHIPMRKSGIPDFSKWQEFIEENQIETIKEAKLLSEACHSSIVKQFAKIAIEHMKNGIATDIAKILKAEELDISEVISISEIVENLMLKESLPLSLEECLKQLADLTAESGKQLKKRQLEIIMRLEQKSGFSISNKDLQLISQALLVITNLKLYGVERIISDDCLVDLDDIASFRSR